MLCTAVFGQQVRLTVQRGGCDCVSALAVAGEPSAAVSLR
jgi:hypothetical protein